MNGYKLEEDLDDYVEVLNNSIKYYNKNVNPCNAFTSDREKKMYFNFYLQEKFNAHVKWRKHTICFKNPSDSTWFRLHWSS